MIVVIQHALKTKDGMDSLVLKSSALQTLITTEPNVYVLTQEIAACHGNIMMEFNVFISQELALQGLLGMEPSVSQIQLVLSDFTNPMENVMPSLKDVCLLPNGIMVVVKWEVLVLMEPTSEVETVSLTSPAKMDKFGTKTW